MDNVYESRDKQVCSFLLIQQGVTFVGTRINNQVVYFRFSPLKKCQELVNQFSSRKAPLTQPKDLLDAVETYRSRVFELKNKEYGK